MYLAVCVIRECLDVFSCVCNQSVWMYLAVCVIRECVDVFSCVCNQRVCGCI